MLNFVSAVHFWNFSLSELNWKRDNGEEKKNDQTKQSCTNVEHVNCPSKYCHIVSFTRKSKEPLK